MVILSSEMTAEAPQDLIDLIGAAGSLGGRLHLSIKFHVFRLGMVSILVLIIFLLQLKCCTFVCSCALLLFNHSPIARCAVRSFPHQSPLMTVPLRNTAYQVSVMFNI